MSDITSTMIEIRLEDSDSPYDEYIRILCSKPLQLTLNSQKGLHLIHLSIRENLSTKMRVCMKGSYRDLLLGCARDACVTYEIDDAMDGDLEELGMRKFYENFLMSLPDFYLEIENNGFRVDEEKRR